MPRAIERHRLELSARGLDIHFLADKEDALPQAILRKDAYLIPRFRDAASESRQSKFFVFDDVGFCGSQEAPKARAALECARWLEGEHPWIEFEPAETHAIGQNHAQHAHQPGVALQQHLRVAGIFEG